MGTAVVLTVVILFAGLAVRKIYKDKKSGKTCSGCGSCSGSCCQSGSCSCDAGSSRKS